MSNKIHSLDDFLLLLKGVKPGRKGQFMALCPGHDDRNRSLSIRLADNKILLRCFADCQLLDILKPLGLQPQDLFLNGHKTVPEYPEIVAIYRYDGFEVVRTRPKGFFQRRPDGRGGYVTNLKGITPTLYHQDELKQAIDVCEGEKDTDRLRSEGFTATCNAMGAGKWRDAYSQALTGADVVIIPDNDQPGRDHAAQVACSCYGKAASIRVLELQDAKDISEWLDKGHTAAELRELANGCPDYKPLAASTLPEIVVTGRHLRDNTTDALNALYKANTPEKIFYRGGALCRISRDELNRPTIELLTESALRGHMDRSANFTRYNGNKSDTTVIPPPLDIVRDINSLGDWKFPALLGITEAPFIRPDGTVFTTPGYDSLTHLYYAPAPGLVVPSIPQKPSSSELKAATELVLEVLCDFAFTDEVNRANAVGALITPVLRPLIGLAPMAVFDKPQPGTGASLLADVISVVATGRPAATMGEPRSEDEFEKKLNAHLLEGRSLCVIDNVDGKLQSDTLARFLTSLYISVRPLGQSADLRLRNSLTYIVTGNNIQLGGDLPRRCFWLRLNAQMSRPWLREGFRHPRLIEWLTENRGKFLASILIIARAWVVAQRPQNPQLIILGGFEDFCHVVGNILHFMGVSGFLGNLSALYDEMDKDTPQWEGFLETWREIIGDTPITVAELVEKLADSLELRNSLPDSLVTRDERNYNRRLGNALAKRSEVYHPNDLMLVKDGTKHRAVLWKVVQNMVNSPGLRHKSELSELSNTIPHMEKSREDNDIYKKGEVDNSPNSHPGSNQCELEDNNAVYHRDPWDEFLEKAEVKSDE
ncbi:hypothetical protein ACFLXC_05035 [Chloroflexota bacterium]